MAGRAAVLQFPGRTERRFWADGMLVVLAIAAAKLLFHCCFNSRYGYFRDEFDYMACGDRLAWGYVDQPPLIPFLIHICRAVLGDSLRSIRFIPALASSVLVVQTAVLAREFGGRRFALLLSAVAVTIAPQYLSNGSLLTTNCLEPNLWMGCAYFAIRAVRDDPRYWVWFGVIAGVGLEEKYTIALFGFAVMVGLLLTEQRRAFRSKWIWLGALAALLIFLPNLMWNFYYHWPFLQLMHNIRAEGRDVVLSPAQYFLQQTFLTHPLTAPIWITGVIALLFSARLKMYRALGWSYVVCYVALSVLHGKNYYLAPVYPMLMAAGAMVIERATERLGQGNNPAQESNNPTQAKTGLEWGTCTREKWVTGSVRYAILAVLVAGGAYFAPITVPVLSPEHFIAYMKYLPMKLPVMEHRHAKAVLPQWYADQFGWNEIVAETAVAWNRLSPEERKDCGIFAQDYGQAGAIDFLGRRYGMPKALSGHQTYFLWGPRGYSGNCMIVLDDTPAKLRQLWDRVEYVGTSADNPYALEREVDVYLCKGAKFGKLADVWPRAKKWR